MSSRKKGAAAQEIEQAAAAAAKTEADEKTDAQEEQTEAAKEDTKGREEMTFPSPCVYCGPSVRGVARQFTTYVGGVPEVLIEFIRQHPAAKGLMVSVNRFAAVRESLNRAGSAETILYKKIKSEL